MVTRNDQGVFNDRKFLGSFTTVNGETLFHAGVGKCFSRDELVELIKEFDKIEGFYRYVSANENSIHIYKDKKYIGSFVKEVGSYILSVNTGYIEPEGLAELNRKLQELNNA